jgi:Arc/MetJ-type ribon-helix-helix transcriptional regulator
LAEKKGKRLPFTSVSLPKPLMDKVERIVNELKYWPTKASFVREAVLEKLEKYKKEFETRDTANFQT